MNATVDSDLQEKRLYHVGIKDCIIESCGGEVTELSYYERNNWVTVELQCKKCKRKFVVKVEI